VTVAPGTADASTTQYFYDDATHAHTIDARGKTWSFTYDARRRRTGMTDPLGRTTSWTYDGMGNMLTKTRPDGGVTTMTYDALRRVTSVKDAANHTTSLVYGGSAFGDGTKGGNLVKLTDAAGSVTLWGYDALDRRVRKTYADASHEDWSFDSAGNLETVTNAGGQVLTIVRDARNRPTSRTWSDGTPAVALSYNAAGRLATLTNSASALTFTYDAAGQLLSETQDLNAPVNLAPLTVSYTYDVDGNRSGMTYPGGSAVSYTYSERNQLSAVTAGSPPPLVIYTYDAGGLRTGKTLENGTNTAYTYDDATRLTALAHRRGTASFLSEFYGYNAADNVLSRGEQVGTAAPAYDVYGYDSIDQLTGVQYSVANPNTPQNPARSVAYVYDVVGNRSGVADTAINGGSPTPYSVNLLNQYTAIDGVAMPTYNVNGGVTRLQTKLSQPVWNYTYDAQNRLTGGTSSNGDGFTFAYDARNRCVARTINGATWLNVWDGWKLLSELDSSGAEQARYIFGPGFDEALCRISSAGASYYHHDKLGSTVALTDINGGLIERTAYDAYGTPAFFDASGSVVAASPSGNRLLFTGREWFASLSLNDHRNRYYAPEIGRWLNRDLIGERGGFNLYSYARNKPVTRIDSRGLSDTWPWTNWDWNPIQALIHGIFDVTACPTEGLLALHDGSEKGKEMGKGRESEFDAVADGAAPTTLGGDSVNDGLPEVADDIATGISDIPGTSFTGDTPNVTTPADTVGSAAQCAIVGAGSK
jgi:RHS repeat-associated protein